MQTTEGEGTFMPEVSQVPAVEDGWHTVPNKKKRGKVHKTCTANWIEKIPCSPNCTILQNYYYLHSTNENFRNFHSFKAFATWLQSSNITVEKFIYRRSENHLKFYSKNSFDKPLIENHSCGPVTKPSSDIEYQVDLKYLKKYKVIADLSKFIISESIKTEFKQEYYYITPKFKQVIKSSNPY